MFPAGSLSVTWTCQGASGSATRKFPPHRPQGEGRLALTLITGVEVQGAPRLGAPDEVSAPLAKRIRVTTGLSGAMSSWV